MRKRTNIKCLIDPTKLCTDCGDCDTCDLDDNKICDSCGKCLGLDAESRAILIDPSPESESTTQKS